MSDKDLRNYVLKELDWDPRIDAANIGVTVDQGVVTLSGHVQTYAEKITAERAVRRIKSVKAIVQQIEVRPASSEGDEPLAHRAVNLLDWDVSIPQGAVKVEVAKGWVHLTGEVRWEYQRRAAEEVMRKLGGVVGVTNDLTLKGGVHPADIQVRIEDALQRYADIEAKGVHLEVVDGKVTLTGSVGSLAERDALEVAVWAAPGVRAVENRVTVRD